MNRWPVQQTGGVRLAHAHQSSACHAVPAVGLLQRTCRFQFLEGLIGTACAERPHARSSDGHYGLAFDIEMPCQACAAVAVGADASTTPLLGGERGPLTLRLVPPLLTHGPIAPRVSQVCIARRWVVEPTAARRDNGLGRRVVRVSGTGNGYRRNTKQQQATRGEWQDNVLNHDCGIVWHTESVPLSRLIHSNQHC